MFNEVLDGTISFPRGKNSFIRDLAEKLNTPHEDASTIFAMLLRGEIPNTRHVIVEKVVSGIKEDWVRRFKDSVISLSKNNIIPCHVFFTSDIEVAGLFSLLIRDIKMESLVGGPLEVQYVNNLIATNLVSYEAGSKRDPFIVIEALLAKKIISQHT